MNDTALRIEQAESGVAHLQLCRPERLNTFDPAFFPALRDAVGELNAAGRTRALVISSAGRHFSAGSKQTLRYAAGHATAEALQQIALLQSAIFDIDEMRTAIAAWQDKRAASFAPLQAVPPA